MPENWMISQAVNGDENYVKFSLWQSVASQFWVLLLKQCLHFELKFHMKNIQKSIALEIDEMS
jgi:hypothetical protein